MSKTNETRMFDYYGWQSRTYFTDCIMTHMVGEWMCIDEINTLIKEADELLAGHSEISRIWYADQTAKIDEVNEGYSAYITYIDALYYDIYEIDHDFFADIKSNAVELLSNVKSDQYSVQEGELAGKYGGITLEDFAVGERTIYGGGETYELELTELEDFSKFISDTYGELAEQNGISVADYCLMMFQNGEFDHTGYHPVKDFLSGLVDVASLGIVPLIEACAGKDFITGETLSDKEIQEKGIEAVLGILSIALIPVTGGGSMTLKTFGAEVLKESISGVAGYVIYEGGEALDLPTGVNMALSMAGTVAVYKTVDGCILKIGKNINNGFVSNADDVLNNIDNLNQEQLENLFKYFDSEDVSKSLTRLSETDTKRANELAEQFLKTKADAVGIDRRIIDDYIVKLDEDAMWDTKSFKETYKRLGDEAGDDWWKLTQKDREDFAFREIDIAELQASKVRQYTNGAQAMDAYGKRYAAGNNYFDHNYTLDEIIDFKVKKDCPSKVYTNIEHGECLPGADVFISDERVLQQVKNLLPDNESVQQCQDLQALADVIYKEKPTVKLVTFQSASGQATNVVTKGDFGYCGGTIRTHGPFQLPVDALDGYAKQYPYYCSYENGAFSITNMEKFGEEVLSGVPLNRASGAYMIMTDVPINGKNISLPSVCNDSSYQAFHVSGGELLSGGTEMTISPIKDIVKVGTVIDKEGITGLDSATGIKYLIKKLEE